MCRSPLAAGSRPSSTSSCSSTSEFGLEQVQQPEPPAQHRVVEDRIAEVGMELALRVREHGLQIQLLEQHVLHRDERLQMREAPVVAEHGVVVDVVLLGNVGADAE